MWARTKDAGRWSCFLTECGRHKFSVTSIGNGLEPLKGRIFLRTLSCQLLIGQLSQWSLNAEWQWNAGSTVNLLENVFTRRKTPWFSFLCYIGCLIFKTICANFDYFYYYTLTFLPFIKLIFFVKKHSPTWIMGIASSSIQNTEWYHQKEFYSWFPHGAKL